MFETNPEKVKSLTKKLMKVITLFFGHFILFGLYLYPFTSITWLLD